MYHVSVLQIIESSDPASTMSFRSGRTREFYITRLAEGLWMDYTEEGHEWSELNKVQWLRAQVHILFAHDLPPSSLILLLYVPDLLA